MFVFDSITKLPALSHNAVGYFASHGGRYCGALALSAGLRGVVLNDAGVGLQRAGIAALPMLEKAGVAAATISHLSSRIGDGDDGYERGRISYVNAIAASLGVTVGDSCRHALQTLAQHAPNRSKETADDVIAPEHRSVVSLRNGQHITLIDSNSLVAPEDAGKIVICGSHGGLLGGNPASAVRIDVRAIVFNDAAVGIDGAGLSRLAALDKRNIAAACVSAWTARIGDAQSSYHTGVISALNNTAIQAGASLGMSTQEFAQQLFHAKHT